MRFRGQSAIEYLLLIGMVVLIIVIVILAVSGLMFNNKTEVKTSTNDASTQLCTLTGLIGNGSGCKSDSDCTQGGMGICNTIDPCYPHCDYSRTPQNCTPVCIVDANCPSGNTCFSPDTNACNNSCAVNPLISSPIQLSDCVALQNIALDKNYVLVNDINCTLTPTWNSNKGFIPIGPVGSFTGTLDGNSHKIFGLYTNWPNLGNYGLFAKTSPSAKILNLGMTQASINGSNGTDLGGFVGENKGLISNSYFSGTLTGTNVSYIGSLAGENNSGAAIIKDSNSSGTVTGASMAGGIAGRNYGSISTSNSSSTVNGGMEAGGLVGYNVGFIKNSYASGSVKGGFADFTNHAGGLVGKNDSNGVISGSYAKGFVSGYTSGGLVGFNQSYIVNSYSSGDVNGVWAGGLVGIAEWDTIGSHITNSFSSGSVIGSYKAGGIAGYDDAVTGTFVNSFSAAVVTCNGCTYHGGLVGFENDRTTRDTNCYWDSTRTTQSIPGQYDEGHGIIPWPCTSPSCNAVSTSSSFYNQASPPMSSWGGGWSNQLGTTIWFTSDGNWGICSGTTYPWLAWENRSCPAVSGPIGWWKFDESSGTAATDSSGNGYNGVVTSGTWGSGKVGGALLFNGSTTVSVSLSAGFYLGGLPYSIAFWVKDDTPASSLNGNYHRIVSWYDESKYIQVGLANKVSPDVNRIFYIFENGSDGWPNQVTKGNAAIGWHHVVATSDGTNFNMYLDGALSNGGAGAFSSSSIVTTANISTATLFMGQRGDNARYLNGSLDDFRIYNRAISAAEVSSLYALGSP